MVLGSGALVALGVSCPVVICGAGAAVFALSLQSLLNPVGSVPSESEKTRAIAIAFPGLFPPVAVTIPSIFSQVFPGPGNKLGIIVMGLGIIFPNRLFIRRSKTIPRAIGPVPRSFWARCSVSCNLRSVYSS